MKPAKLEFNSGGDLVRLCFRAVLDERERACIEIDLSGVKLPLLRVTSNRAAKLIIWLGRYSVWVAEGKEQGVKRL